jgi:hypothetical protein
MMCNATYCKQSHFIVLPKYFHRAAALIWTMRARPCVLTRTIQDSTWLSPSFICPNLRHLPNLMAVEKATMCHQRAGNTKATASCNREEAEASKKTYTWNFQFNTYINIGSSIHWNSNPAIHRSGHRLEHYTCQRWPVNWSQDGDAGRPTDNQRYENNHLRVGNN